MRTIMVALVIETPHGVSRELIEEQMRDRIEPAWFMDDATLKVTVIERDMPAEEFTEGVDEIGRCINQLS